jgi:hypothetical protein
MDKTAAKMGRSIKNREFTGRFLAWLDLPAAWEMLQDR